MLLAHTRGKTEDSVIQDKKYSLHCALPTEFTLKVIAPGLQKSIADCGNALGITGVKLVSGSLAWLFIQLMFKSSCVIQEGNSEKSHDFKSPVLYF